MQRGATRHPRIRPPHVFQKLAVRTVLVLVVVRSLHQSEPGDAQQTFRALQASREPNRAIARLDSRIHCRGDSKTLHEAGGARVEWCDDKLVSQNLERYITFRDDQAILSLFQTCPAQLCSESALNLSDTRSHWQDTRDDLVLVPDLASTRDWPLGWQTPWLTHYLHYLRHV